MPFLRAVVSSTPAGQTNPSRRGTSQGQGHRNSLVVGCSRDGHCGEPCRPHRQELLTLPVVAIVLDRLGRQCSINAAREADIGRPARMGLGIKLKSYYSYFCSR